MLPPCSVSHGALFQKGWQKLSALRKFCFRKLIECHNWKYPQFLKVPTFLLSICVFCFLPPSSLQFTFLFSFIVIVQPFMCLCRLGVNLSFVKGASYCNSELSFVLISACLAGHAML